MKLIANKKYIYKIVIFIFIVIVLVSLKYELLWNGVSFHHIITAFFIGMYVFQKVSYYIQHPTGSIWNWWFRNICLVVSVMWLLFLSRGIRGAFCYSQVHLAEGTYPNEIWVVEQYIWVCNGRYYYERISPILLKRIGNIWNMQTNDIEKNAIQNGDYIAIYNADKRNIMIKFKNYDNGAYEITDYVPWE